MRGDSMTCMEMSGNGVGIKLDRHLRVAQTVAVPGAIKPRVVGQAYEAVAHHWDVTATVVSALSEVPLKLPNRSSEVAVEFCKMLSALPELEFLGRCVDRDGKVD